MTREDKYLLGCLFAIHRLQEKGSVEFATKVDGKWERISWSEICEWIEKQYAIEKEKTDQELFINKPCVSSGICEHDKNVALDKIRSEIINYECNCRLSGDEYPSCKQCTDNVFETIYSILDKYKAESEDKE